ncbi:MAG: hypothetical protein EOP53_12870, partial [Sphingobacteriales bacterium]
MLKLILLHCWLMLSLFAFSQNRKPGENSFSHFYFVLDTAAYQTLITNSFCKDSLFMSRESKASMDQGTWQANYLTGPYDYLEIMKPDAANSMPTGGIGLGNILHRPDEAVELQQQWQKLTKDKIEILHFTTKKGQDTSITELMNYRDSMMSGGKACFFVMYYHPSIMLKSGFSRSVVLDSGLSQQAINSGWYGVSVKQKLYNK